MIPFAALAAPWFAALSLGINAQPIPSCQNVTPVLAYIPAPAGATQAMGATNFRDERGNCYVLLNLATFQWRGRRAMQASCKFGEHESGHLNGFHEDGGPDGGAHSADPTNVMSRVFNFFPVPPACENAGDPGIRSVG